MAEEEPKRGVAAEAPDASTESDPRENAHETIGLLF